VTTYLSFAAAGTPRALRTQNLKGNLTRESSATSSAGGEGADSTFETRHR